MNINIKHDKLLRETSKKLGIEPSVLVNTLVDSLEFIPAGFEDISKKGAQIMVDRILEGILLDNKKIEMAKNETDDLYLDELEADDLEWKLEINSEPNNESDNAGFTSLELLILAEEFSSIPPLVKLNDILGEFEKIVRKQ